ncbi:MAG: thiamine-monophosphate kinase [Pirellulales bacterium]|nr:thiamine-monophosphate kinase [Pirellulales bacterium]
MEREFVEWLVANLPPSPLLRIGPGDDAAVLAWPPEGDLVATTDAITDQVDFLLEEVDPVRVGRKALGVNLSDLAAMAAEPVAALVSLVLPRRGAGGRSTRELAEAIYRGMLPLAEQHACVIAGGDTNTWDGPLAISVTALGRVGPGGALLRSGARPGDQVLVTGALGGSLLGRHLDVEPRVREALLLRERFELTAGMDVSDGLALDASRLAAASGCGLVIDPAAVPIAPAAHELASRSGRMPLDHALGDGEDFELLVTAPAVEAERLLREQPLGIPVTRVGWCIAAPGLWQPAGGEALQPLAPTGYLHADEPPPAT